MQDKYRVFDAHCDTLSLIADGASEERCDFTAADAGMYRGYTQVFACFIAPRYRECAMDRFDMLAGIFDSLELGGVRSILSVEGADMIRGEEDVDILYSRGVRCISLTWNHSNRLAGGAYDETCGLTELGRAVLRRMGMLGIVADVSHLNDRSFYDVIAAAEGPVAATHSNSRAVCAHRRNLTDEMFGLICERGGCAGINLFPPFLAEDGAASASDAAEHIMHWLELGGENAVGLGSDLDGTEGRLPRDIRGCRDIYKLFDELSARGVPEEITEKISHRNFERVFNI